MARDNESYYGYPKVTVEDIPHQVYNKRGISKRNGL